MPIVSTIATAALMIGATLAKYYLIGSKIEVDYLLAVLFVVVMVVVFVGGIFLYSFVSGSEQSSSPRFYATFMAIFAVTFISDIFLSSISPLLIAPGFMAVAYAYISRSKKDIFIFNFAQTTLVFFICYYEYLFTPGYNMFMAIGDPDSYLLLLLLVSIVSIAAGSFISMAYNFKPKRTSYLRAGLLTTFFSIALYALISLLFETRSELLLLSWVFAIGAVMPILFSLLILPFAEHIFNLVTDFRLIEYTDTNHPLIKKLIREAPGTYNHSLGVANFAQMCATAIGENPYMAMACAYFHDVGKLHQPSFFTENQSGGINPHDRLLPEVSADIIRNHTTDGYALCTEYGLPEEIKDVTIQHHGTLSIRYFLNKSRTLTDGEVNESDYQYHGVTPTTKIAAIIMICDSAEAAIRSMDNPDGFKVESLLKGIIKERIESDQFVNCPISMEDLNTIQQTIIEAYGGVFHKRIKYQGQKE
ncbi:MAG: HDIG domain-containing protein [Clostridia bacterium]|nr:HDIG domain-containing protein [Clostridia bacterium]